MEKFFLRLDYYYYEIVRNPLYYLGMVLFYIGGIMAFLFTLGLFSLIDAIMDDSMENLMSQIPLSGKIKEVLISRTGDLSGYLNLVESYEKGDWEEIARASERIGIHQDDLPGQYTESLGWADSLNVLQ